MGTISEFLKVRIKLDSMFAHHMQFGVQAIQFFDDVFEALKFRTVLDLKLFSDSFVVVMAFSQCGNLRSKS